MQIRMNVDMTTANIAIRCIRHVIPTLEELRYKLNNKKHFTKLDMRHSYMQYELDSSSRPITTFYTYRGLRRSRHLTFGINSAAEVFHEEIRQTLTDIPNVNNIYDDILISGETQEEHDLALCHTQEEHDLALCHTLQRLADCRLTLNLNKCVFDKPQINFFGVIFSHQGLAPSPEKIQALLKAPDHNRQPKSAHFWAWQISAPTSSTAPLRNLTKKNNTFQWDKEAENCFNTIRQSLVTQPVMAYFNPQRKTKLIVDGSKKTGLGSILTQYDPTVGGYRVIRYDSRPTTLHEQRYLQIEIESAAVEFGVTRNHIYLYGLPTFTISTDHKPLIPLYTTYKKDPPVRILKNKLCLQGYNYKMIFEPGESNAADYLSRHPENKSQTSEEAVETELFVDNVIANTLPDAVTTSDIQRASRHDETTQRLENAIDLGYIPLQHVNQLADYKHILQELTVKDGIIMRGQRIVVPQSLRSSVVQAAHEGYQGLPGTRQDEAIFSKSTLVSPHQ